LLVRIVVLQHEACEGPGVFEDAITSEGHDLTFVRLYDGESVPGALSAWERLIILGGLMNVY
jgi:GMP synthase (glutamine-hydrolysing)